jgi:threonine dehydrogenase-like Zn-dependent dehydrogenase
VSRALSFDGKLKLDKRRRTPERPAGEALLRVRQAGICSTDLEICRGYMGFRGVLGHEFVATVEEADDETLVGKRVVGEINCVCRQCDLCKRGLSSHCRNRTVLGIVGRDGAFADWCVLPERNLHVLPDTVGDDEATFVEPLAAAVQVERQLGPLLNDRTWVTVLGGGRLGLLVAQVLAQTKAAVRVVGRNAGKLQLCERWGIKSRHLREIEPRHDQDVVVDCTGNAAGLGVAAAMCRPRGTLVLKSTVAPSPTGQPIDLAPIVIDEITIQGSRCGPFAPAIKLLAEARVDVASLVSRRFRLDDGPEAMRAASEGNVLKALLTM